jgi:hypothetical protein
MEVRYHYGGRYYADFSRWKGIFKNLKKCHRLPETSKLSKRVSKETKQSIAATNNLYTHLSQVDEIHEASQGNENGDGASGLVGSDENSIRTQPYLKVLVSDDPLAELIRRWHEERLRSEVEVCDYYW